MKQCNVYGLVSERASSGENIIMLLFYSFGGKFCLDNLKVL